MECLICLQPDNLKKCCDNCSVFVHEECYQSWFRVNRPGSILRINNLKCPFCKQYSTSNKVCDNLNPEYNYFICMRCTQIKNYSGQICMDINNLICDNCAAPSEITEMSTIKLCPVCEIAIEKHGGCNNIICQCGAEWDWESREVYHTNEDIIDYINEEIRERLLLEPKNVLFYENQNKSFYQSILRINKNCIRHMSDRMIRLLNDEDVLFCLDEVPYAVVYLKNKNDELIMKAIHCNPRILNYLFADQYHDKHVYSALSYKYTDTSQFIHFLKDKSEISLQRAIDIFHDCKYELQKNHFTDIYNITFHI